ncbi:MAG: DUF4922 domain-containing protein [Ignavibacteria bacterium]
MIKNVLLTDNELTAYLNDNYDCADKTRALLAQQKDTWLLLQNGYSGLDNVKIRTFEFDDYKIKVQFNPGRIVSSSAKVDAKSINERKCFLCYKHLPSGQKSILYPNDYLILCNPFPIFNEHFTLPNVKHVSQNIETSFYQFLMFAKDLGRYYTIFYNGPGCGASAPDHLHFQAGNKYFMPIDTDYDQVKISQGTLIKETGKLKIYFVDKYPARFFSFESSDIEILQKTFRIFLKAFSELSTPGEEPMMNLISSYEENRWRVIVFPRGKHRPSYYFAKGDENILLSPASVDMGGVLITPLEKDFCRITKDNIIDIFQQIMLTNEHLEYIKKSLIENT